MFPVATLALGWPAETPEITTRLALAPAVHRNRFDGDKTRAQVDAYDRRRHAIQPYACQRGEADHGTAGFYGWSEEKARHCAKPERTDFGRFVEQKGFNLR